MDENYQVLSSGSLIKPQEKTDTLQYFLNIDKLTFAGGYLNIKKNICELIIMGSGVPYTHAYTGILRKNLF